MHKEIGFQGRDSWPSTYCCAPRADDFTLERSHRPTRSHRLKTPNLLFSWTRCSHPNANTSSLLPPPPSSRGTSKALSMSMSNSIFVAQDAGKVSNWGSCKAHGERADENVERRVSITVNCRHTIAEESLGSAHAGSSGFTAVLVFHFSQNT